MKHKPLLNDNEISKIKQFNFELKNLKYEIEHLTSEMNQTESKVKEMTNVILAAKVKANEAIAIANETKQIATQNAEEIRIFKENSKEISVSIKESNMMLKALLTRNGINLEDLKLSE